MQGVFRGWRAKKVADFRISALKNADDLVEEAGLLPLELFNFYMDILVQYAIVLLFAAGTPWVPLVMLGLNCLDIRVRPPSTYGRLHVELECDVTYTSPIPHTDDSTSS